jgi:hypothetical protein
VTSMVKDSTLLMNKKNLSENISQTLLKNR